MLLHQRDPELGFAKKAFEASERSKVRSLLDLLTTSDQDAPCDELLQRQLEVVDATEVRAIDAKQGAPSVAPTLTLEEVQAEIGNEDTALLEYALGDEKSYVWVVGPHQITSHELPKSAQIRQSVDAFRKALIPAQLRNEKVRSTTRRERVVQIRHIACMRSNYHDCFLSHFLFQG